ncbi:MAG TPA: hypothetical protein GX524_06420 [Firmicutes bacterium]|jgi:hypothetical protein|nr:hypothetical protein [Bacillota bacterium]
MEILGVEVNPYELFLILILLLAATGSFDQEDDCKNPKDISSGQESGSPVRILGFLNQPLVMNAPGYRLQAHSGKNKGNRRIFGAKE